MTVIIAENAPVIATGISVCLNQSDSPRCKTIMVDSMAALIRHVKENPSAIVLADPGFGGVFNPDSIRRLNEQPTKIIAIETSTLPRPTRALYDDTFPVLDDIPSLIERLRRVNKDAEDVGEKKSLLSNREKEIIINVVKGFTNKEIADRLFLSVHTVVTHRRNIARKLEIHSATGLTIYAIVNGLVDLSEVKL